MKLMSFKEFMDDFGRGAPNTMNLSIYRDFFQCACGQSHWFDESIDVICQGWMMKIMVACPDDPSYLTSLKIKTFMIVKFKGFESLTGTQASGSEDTVAIATIREHMRHR